MKNGGNYEYQYSIADHQGNTRVVFTSAAPIAQNAAAGFETSNQTTEQSKFSNYSTSNAYIDSNPANAHAGTNSYKLNGGYAGVVGLSKSYKVFPGDKLHIDAWAKVESQSCTNCGSSGLGNFATVLFNAFNVGAPALGETGTLSAGLNAWAGVNTAAGYGDGSTDITDPKVFVTIVIFDKDYKFIEVTYSQLTSSGSMSADFVVKEAGYAIMYVSNEMSTPTYVYFDDVKMSYTPTNIIQNNEYYAHSMPTANSWTRDNNTNNFLGNGGTELNATTQLYDLAYRNYDASLGRFHQVDPLAGQFSSLTPYNYAFNNPVMMNDPLGDKPQVELTFDIQNIPRPNCLDRSDNYDTGGGYQGGGGPEGFGPYGGSLTNNGDGTFRKTLFKSYDEAFAAGAAYNEKHKSWDYTAYGSYRSSVVSYVGSTVYGVLLSPTQVNGALAKVRQNRIQQMQAAVLLASSAAGNGWLGMLTQDGPRGYISIRNYDPTYSDYSDGYKKVGVNMRVAYNPTDEEKGTYNRYNFMVVVIVNGKAQLLTSDLYSNEGPYYYGDNPPDNPSAVSVWGKETFSRIFDKGFQDSKDYTLSYQIGITVFGMRGKESTPLGTVYAGFEYQNGTTCYDAPYIIYTPYH